MHNEWDNNKHYNSYFECKKAEKKIFSKHCTACTIKIQLNSNLVTNFIEKKNSEKKISE